MFKYVIALCVSVSVFGRAAMADDAPTGAMRHALNLGVTLTEGNSETLQVNAMLLTEGERERLGSVRAGLEANYGESRVAAAKERTVENARLFANAKKTISERTFASLDASLLHDAIATIDYRATVAPGLGAYARKDARTSLFVEAGPAYIWEQVGGEVDAYLALRLAERAERVLSDTANLWQALEYLPRTASFGDFLLNAEVGVEAAVNAAVKLRLVLQNKHDSSPAEGLKKNDLSVIAGVGVSL